VSVQSLGFDAAPLGGWLQNSAPAPQSVFVAHGAPGVGPPKQSLPPHVMPAGQSALEKHGVAAVVPQTLQKHFLPAAPVQFGLSAERVRVLVDVLVGSVIGRLPITFDGGGQSKLVGPNVGLVPPTSHVCPSLGPAEHVPPRFPSSGVGSFRHLGQGAELSLAWTTWETKETVASLSPLSMLAVPEIVPVTSLTTQVETAPAVNGSGAPKKNLHVPPVHALSLVHSIEVSLVQRRLLEVPAPASGLAIGPLRLQTPQGGELLAHPDTDVVTLPLSMILEF
jgi:hypothetical protein